MAVGAADPRQRRRRSRGRLVAAGGRDRAAAAEAFQLVRSVGARDHRVAQLVFRQTLAVAALERVRRTPCEKKRTKKKKKNR